MKEDLNRHIPQQINEFASLALAGRYRWSVFRLIWLWVRVFRAPASDQKGYGFSLENWGKFFFFQFPSLLGKKKS